MKNATVRFLLLTSVINLIPIAHAARIQADQINGIFPHQRSNSPNKKNATIGKYLYVGVAPRFAPEDLTMVASKIGLTLRVTGRVSQEFHDQYALQLYRRFKLIHDAFLENPKMSFISLQSMATLESRAKARSTQLWLKVAAPYTAHVLEGRGVAIEADGVDTVGYKKNILTALLRYYLQSNELTLESIPVLDSYFQDPAYVTRLSNDLFNFHLGTRFAAMPNTDEKNGKNYLGYVTYVYPIAATAEGPFSQPREGVRGFGLSGNIESRVWSDKWQDEFGGMPFLLIDWSGIAYHGPITNYGPLDIWYLRRDFVSHGCHRMDSSDILELRSILPANVESLERLKKQIHHVTLTWPDVTDWDNDGKLEVIDVQYHDLPTWFPEPKKTADLDEISKRWMGNAAVATWRKKHYITYNKHKDAGGTPIYDPETQLYSGLPIYQEVKDKLVRNGVHGPLPVFEFPYQPNRILQYDDGKPIPQGFDNTAGKYSPPYFTH